MKNVALLTITAVLLSSLLFISLPLADAAASDKISVYWDESEYTYTTAGAGNEGNPYRSTITDYKIGNRTDITIKSAMEGFPLTKIADNAFKGNITSAIVPATVESIGNGAFSSCTQLMDVYFLGDLPAMGMNAFPGGVTFHYLEGEGWETTTATEMITVMQNGVLYYIVNGEAVVHAYKSGSNISIPNTVTIDSTSYPVVRVGAYSFYNVKTPQISITLGNDIKVVEERAFYGCSALKKITLGNVLYVNDEAFRHCDNFEGTNKKLVLSSSVKYLGFESFRMCHSLTSATIPDSVEFFGEGVLRASFGLKEVTFGNSIKDLGDWAMDNCSTLVRVNFKEGLETIGDYAFVNCTALKSVSFPNSLISIGNNAFNNCTSLSSLSLGSIENIGNNAFQSCKSLNSVTIPSSVTNIDDRAFALCSDLKTVHFKGDKPEMGTQVFNGSATGFKVTYEESHAASWEGYSEYPSEIGVESSGDDSSDGSIWTYVAIALAAVLVAAIAVVILKRRS